MESLGSKNESPRPDHLLTLPLEVRRAIYRNLVPELSFIYEAQNTIHLSQAQNGVLRLSRCCNPSTYYLDVGLERSGFPLHGNMEDRIWQRRLLSTWGPHWRCEEEMDRKPEVEGLPLLSVCKTTRIEFAEILAEHTRFEITSLEDIDHLAKPHPAMSIESLVVPHVLDLSITLNLPFGLFQEIQTPTPLLGAQAPEEIQNLVRLWHSFPRSILKTFPRLRFLRFWADHDEPKMWSAQSMTAFLDAVNKLVFPEEVEEEEDDDDDGNSSDSRNGNSELGASLQKVRVVLPRRHPFKEIEIRWPKIAFAIEEVRRLKYRVRKNEKGKSEVYYVDEWPQEAALGPMLSMDALSALQAADARMRRG